MYNNTQMILYIFVYSLWTFSSNLQAEDVDLMIERMEEQIKQLTKAYREELTQVEVSELN